MEKQSNLKSTENYDNPTAPWSSTVDIHPSKFGNNKIEICILKRLGKDIGNLMNKNNGKQL